MGLLGAVHLLPPLIHTLGLHFYSQTLTTLTLNLVNRDLAGLPQIGVGLFLLMMSIGLLLALLASFRFFDRSSLATATLFAATCLALLSGYGVIGSYVLGDQFRPPIDSLEQALYFTIETLSTVGYGDIVAQTSRARLFLVSLISVGASALAYNTCQELCRRGEKVTFILRREPEGTPYSRTWWWETPATWRC